MAAGRKTLGSPPAIRYDCADEKSLPSKPFATRRVDTTKGSPRFLPKTDETEERLMKYPTFFDFPAKSSLATRLTVLTAVIAALISLPFLFSERSQTRPRTTVNTNSNPPG